MDCIVYGVTKSQTRLSNLKKKKKNREEISEKLMNETIAKINKTKSWFFEKMNKIYRLIEKKGRRIKTIKLEVKMERLQQTTQKYKIS